MVQIFCPFPLMKRHLDFVFYERLRQVSMIEFVTYHHIWHLVDHFSELLI